MPHCKLACSRNLFCKTWRTPLVASPSTVSIFLPCASTPSIRHESIARPSTITMHAPQPPVRHPSLEPVSSSTSRKVSSRLCRGSHRNSTVSPLIVASTKVFFITICRIFYYCDSGLFRAFGCDCQGAAREHAGDVQSKFRCPAHVVDWLAGLARDASGDFERCVVEFFADERIGGLARE